MRAFNPGEQKKICKDAPACHFGDYPTLRDIGKIMGEGTVTAWLMVQIYDLSEFCGCRGKMDTRQTEQTAEILGQEWARLKVTELMLFFWRFKCGRYGRFYGQVDPMVITCSMDDFARERSMAFSEREKLVTAERAEREREDCISLEEYIRRKRLRGESGGWLEREMVKQK